MVRKTQADLHPTTVGKYKELVPEGVKFYRREGLIFTDYAQQMILDLVKMGEHLYAACQIAGVHPATLTYWLRKGRECTDETDAYYRFLIRYKDARLKGLKILRDRQRQRLNDPQGYGDNPRMSMDNPLPMALYTAENRQSILAYLRDGAFPGVAAEASGVPELVYRYWLDRGREEMQHQGDGDIIFLDFYLDVMKTSAQARAQAESEVYNNQSLAWLLHGPGRDSSETPGWTKQSQIVGASGGPIQVLTEWRVSTNTTQLETVESTVQQI